ncbi:phospholipase D-like domain-containing protein [Xanthomonas phaseoli]|uniref:phospholipase D-like domain-containing protein n=1 Tax=Xanthomonas phaseoli TaxID=1985254 RepID=UPI001E5BEE44|nr:phospholipase D-like domain-containing protein [Xanthomonas phaseoli]MCC8471513.1 phospholipase D-like domain-containing protein [Xanthomonas phaseoli]
MSKKLIIQGISESNHLDGISEVFDLDGIKSGIVSVAFIRASGVLNIKNILAGSSEKITIYAGIRNGITSAQAIKALLDIGVKVFLVDTGSAHKIFHPKLYFARNLARSRLLVGSANLTSGGLSGNIEASLVVEQDHADKTQLELSNSVETLFSDMAKDYPDNVQLLKANTSIEALLEDLRLVDEALAIPPITKAATGKSASAIPVMNLKSRKLQNVARPSSKKVGLPSTVVPSAPLPLSAASIPGSYEVMWRTDELTERDLGIPTGATTSATGSMNLDRGDLTGDYEWSYYFRDTVFKHLAWSIPDKKQNQTAVAKFRIVVAGVDYGEHELKVTHDTKVGTPSYNQRNAMTRLSWGPAHSYVAKRQLIGRSLTLSRMIGYGQRFMIEID